MDLFLQEVNVADEYTLAQLLDPFGRSPFYPHARALFAGQPADKLVPGTSGLDNIIRNYIDLVNMYDPDAPLDGALALRIFRRVQHMSRAVDSVFMESDEDIWVPLLENVSRALVYFAMQVTKLSDATFDPTNTESSDKYFREAADRLARQIISINRIQPADNAKKRALVPLLNLVFRIYFHMGKLGQAENVWTNALSGIEYALPWASRAELVTYEYFSGRLYLSKRQFPEAWHAFRRALAECHIGARKNQRLILMYCLATSLVLGKVPRQDVVQAMDLGHIGHLAALARTGRYGAVQAYLYENRALFQRDKIFVILDEYLGAVCWRNVLRQALNLLKLDRPAAFAPDKIPHISLNTVALAATIQFGELVFLDDAEAACCSLIYDKKVKGYIVHGSTLVLQRGANLGIVPWADMAG